MYSFRRVPVHPEDRWAAAVAFAVDGDLWAAEHYALPFGAVGSVHGWDRVGALIQHLAAVLLHMPISRLASYMCVCACCGSVQCRHCRYVDDFFGPLQEGCLEHGVQHFVELVRLLLGKKAIANRKVEWSRNHSPLVILGVEVLITDEGFRCSPSPKHTAKWLAVIADSMANDRMCPGTASKLAGALSWGAQNMFFRQALAFTMFMFALVCVCCVRFGRAMLRPLFTQQYGRSSTINEPLRLALAWWQEVLQLQIADTKEWYAQQQQVQPKPPPLIPTM